MFIKMMLHAEPVLPQLGCVVVLMALQLQVC
jgi:hypothetical protein